MRNRWVVAAFVGVQVAIPAMMAVVRWTVMDDCVSFGWHMFSC